MSTKSFYVYVDVEVDEDNEEVLDNIDKYITLDTHPYKSINYGVVLDNGDLYDGSHTFDELYYHRMMLFAIICNQNSELAWKSWKHDNGVIFEDYFIVGLNTPEGQYSYHYHKDHWNMFRVTELDNAPEWDGHMPRDIGRLLSILK